VLRNPIVQASFITVGVFPLQSQHETFVNVIIVQMFAVLGAVEGVLGFEPDVEDESLVQHVEAVSNDVHLTDLTDAVETVLREPLVILGHRRPQCDVERLVGMRPRHLVSGA